MKGDFMKIKKVLNNNAVIAIDSDNEDVVVTGLGLAFQKKSGDTLEDKRVERIFHMENKEVSRKLTELVSEIPIEYVEITEEIIGVSKETLNRKLNENIYLSLTDHICFAVERIEKGFDIKNPLLWEIRRIYTKEYEIGLKALDIVKNRLGVELPEDEAASIAIHLVNSEMDEETPNVMKLIKILQDELTIIKYHYGIELKEDSFHYQRLVTHLKFFAQRIINGEKESAEDDALFKMVADQYQDAYHCAMKIKKYVVEKHNFEVKKSELTYLIVHIEKVIQSSRNGE